MPLPADIEELDDNDNDADIIDMREDPDDGEYNVCKYFNDRSDNTMYDVESEADYANDRSKNIRPDYNEEASIIGKIVTNVEANASKAENTEITRLGVRYYD